MSERPKKKECSCSYDPITNELISAWGCECGAEIWNACIDAWEAWEKENPRLERLDERKVIKFLDDLDKDREVSGYLRFWFAHEICKTFGQPKDAVSVPTVEEISNILSDELQTDCVQSLLFIYKEADYEKAGLVLAQAIHALITSKLKGQDNEAK